MSGIPLVTKTGPRSYTPADNQTIKAGNVVAASSGGRVAVAGAGSTKVLGVALNDAIAPEDVVDTTGTPPVVPAYPQNTKVAVAYGGVEVPVVYAANADFGARLVAASDGKVTPLTGFASGQDQPNVDFTTVIGICTEPGGVNVSTNNVGLMRVTV